MTTITVKNIPDDLYARLKQSAAENRRSINREIIVCIERAVFSPKHRDIDDILARARRIRASTNGKLLTDEDFTKLKTTGRQ